MSRTVTVRDIQDAIADINCWANGDGPTDPDTTPSDMLRAIASMLESLLVHREKSDRG